tara:strand:- start:4551 stop:4886 length:336 start_codon:yes stop_codon:yes gene_type:complete
MKSNTAREIENKLKEVFTPNHLLVEQSALVSKKFKILIVSSKFANKSSVKSDNDKEVYQALKDRIRVANPAIEELDIATFIPSNYSSDNLVEFKTYKYYDMLPNFSKQLVL